MNRETVILFTRNGLGEGPAELQRLLAQKFLLLLLENGDLPGKILFYTDGVRLACDGSPVLDALAALEARGVELVLCQTCLNAYGLSGSVKTGVVGGMGDILQALSQAAKVIAM